MAYKLYRSRTASVIGELIETFDTFPKTLTGQQHGINYFRVSATNEYGEGRTTGAIQGVSVAPAGAITSTTVVNKVTLSVPEIEGADTYHLDAHIGNTYVEQATSTTPYFDILDPAKLYSNWQIYGTFGTGRSQSVGNRSTYIYTVPTIGAMVLSLTYTDTTVTLTVSGGAGAQHMLLFNELTQASIAEIDVSTKVITIPRPTSDITYKILARAGFTVVYSNPLFFNSKAPVRNATATFDGAGTVNISWIAPVNTTAINTKIDMTSPTGVWSQIHTVEGATSYARTGLVEAGTYTFNISARYANGYSEVVTVTAVVVLVPIRNMTAVFNTTTRKIDVNWLAPLNNAYTGTRVWYRVANGTWNSYTLEKGITQYSVTPSTTGSYEIIVSALYNAVEVMYTPTAVVAVDLTIPIPPTNLTATQSGSNIIINWTHPVGFTPTRYTLEYSKDGVGESISYNIPATTTSYTFTPPAAGTYIFFMRSYYETWLSTTWATSNTLVFTPKVTYSGTVPTTNPNAVGNVWTGVIPSGVNTVRMSGVGYLDTSGNMTSQHMVFFSPIDVQYTDYSLGIDSFEFSHIAAIYPHMYGQSAALGFVIQGLDMGGSFDLAWNLEFYNS